MNLKKIIGSAVIALSLSTPVLAQEQEKININAFMQVAPQYQLRGLQITDKLTLQGILSANYKGFTATFFGNKGLEEGESNEVDFMVDYTREFGNFSLTGGYAYLAFTGEDLKSQEVYTSLNHTSGFNANIAYDFDLGSGVYGEVGITGEIELIGIPISFTEKVAFNHEYFRKNSGFSHTQLDVDIPIELGKNFTLIPGLTITKSFVNEEGDAFFPISDEIYPRIGININIGGD